MTRNEINAKLAEAIEKLQRAKPGTGTTDQRRENREEAGEILTALPQNWFRRADAGLLAMLTDLA